MLASDLDGITKALLQTYSEGYRDVSNSPDNVEICSVPKSFSQKDSYLTHPRYTTNTPSGFVAHI
jgi:hypothetical protein